MNLDVHPDGELVVFDLLGDLYTMPIAGGEARRLTDGPAYDMQPRFSPDGKQLLFTSDRSGGFNIWIAPFEDGELGKPEARTEEKTETDRRRGLGFLRRLDPRTQTIHRYQFDRCLGPVGLSHLDGGSGIELIGTAQVGEVDGISTTRDGRWIYLGTRRPFGYNRNPYGSIWSIQRYDRDRGVLDPVSVGFGSSAVPQLSPDEKALAFVRRIDGKTTLWLHDLATGGERQIWDGLDRDQIESFATHGAYPGYDWTPDGRSIVIWAGGGLHRVSPFGDLVDVAPIPFEAEVEQQVHQVLRQPREAVGDNVEARILRWPVQSPRRQEPGVSGAGASVPYAPARRSTAPADRGRGVRALPGVFRPMVHGSSSPPGTTISGGALYRMRWPDGTPEAIYRVPTQVANPSFSPDGRWIVFAQGSGANLRGQDLGSELRHDLHLLPADGGVARFVVSTSNRGPNRRITRPVFGSEGQRVYYLLRGSPRHGRFVAWAVARRSRPAWSRSRSMGPTVASTCVSVTRRRRFRTRS